MDGILWFIFDVMIFKIMVEKQICTTKKYYYISTKNNISHPVYAEKKYLYAEDSVIIFVESVSFVGTGSSLPDKEKSYTWKYLCEAIYDHLPIQIQDAWGEE